MAADQVVAFSVFAASFLCVYLAVSIRDAHKAFQFLFVSFALLLLATGLDFAGSIAAGSGAPWAAGVEAVLVDLYWLSLIVFMLTLLYFMLMFILGAIEATKKEPAR